VVKKKVLAFYPNYMSFPFDIPGYLDVYRHLLEENTPEAEFFVCENREEVEKYAPEVEIAFVPHDFPQDLFKRMPKLEWIQVMAAGIELYIENANQFRNIPVCRIVGAHGKYMVEYVFAYLLHLSQDITRVLRAQTERQWDPFLPEFIHQKTLGIMGLGAVGTLVAERANGMGMRVVSWDTVQRDTPFVHHQYKAYQMKEFLGEADYVLLALPETSQTTNLINRDAFKSMKQSAYLINICRGSVVEERDLVEALKGNELAGAILDVVKEEPLQPDSKLWDCPNLIISPHISGPSIREDMIVFFKENFRRYLQQEPLVGLVDFERGY